jgi:hypothetical protein
MSLPDPKGPEQVAKSPEPDQAAVALLRRECHLLAERVRDWTPARWRAAAGRGYSRSDRMWALVHRLGEWGRRAGDGAPPQAVPARLGDHALVDQLRVMAADLLAAPGVATVAAQALADVLRTRTLLDGTRPPAYAAAVAGLAAELEAGTYPAGEPADRRLS